MGFFSDLKEDLSQAVSELRPDGEPSLDDETQAGAEVQTESEVQADAVEAAEISAPPESADVAVSLDEMLANIDEFRLPEDLQEETETSAVIQEETSEQPGDPMLEELLAEMLNDTSAEEVRDGESHEDIQPEESLPEEFQAEEPQPEESQAEEFWSEEPQIEESQIEESQAEESQVEEPQAEETQAEEPVTDQYEEQIEESKGAERIMENNSERIALDETSVITEGMSVTGDIVTEGSLDVIGTVNGNIDAYGKLNITGHINGNSKAAEIYAESAKINGEIVSEGAVKIGASSVVIGNISATSAAIAGAVKGDIDVRGPVILDASAIVMGNIKSKSVQINNGAVIEGMCSQCYADVSPTSFFDDYKPEANARKSKTK